MAFLSGMQEREKNFISHGGKLVAPLPERE